MKIFISFRFTGEPFDELLEFFRPVWTELEQRGYTVACSLRKEAFYKEHAFSTKQMLEDAFQELESSDILVAVVRSLEKSEGMLMEVGYAHALHKPIVACVYEGVSTFVQDVATDALIISSTESVLPQLTNCLKKYEGIY